MFSTSHRILIYLNDHPTGADDDELAAALGLKRRQSANIVCRRLASKHLIQRQRVNGKIRNYGLGLSLPDLRPVAPATDVDSRPWFWEGHVQDRVVQYLSEQGYTILRTANTATHEQGKDIEAQKEGQMLWVSVKGYPKGTLCTNPQCRRGIGSWAPCSI